MADDLATTLLLATDTPVMMAPAMNVRMWEHAATRANAETQKRKCLRLQSSVYRHVTSYAKR